MEIHTHTHAHAHISYWIFFSGKPYQEGSCSALEKMFYHPELSPTGYGTVLPSPGGMKSRT